MTSIPCPSNPSLGICSNRGNCNDTTGICHCNTGWGGADCSYPISIPCPSNNPDLWICSNHGTCDYSTGRCHCNTDWGGSDCSYPIKVVIQGAIVNHTPHKLYYGFIPNANTTPCKGLPIPDPFPITITGNTFEERLAKLASTYGLTKVMHPATPVPIFSESSESCNGVFQVYYSYYDQEFMPLVTIVIENCKVKPYILRYTKCQHFDVSIVAPDNNCSVSYNTSIESVHPIQCSCGTWVDEKQSATNDYSQWAQCNGFGDTNKLRITISGGAEIIQSSPGDVYDCGRFKGHTDCPCQYRVIQAEQSGPLIAPRVTIKSEKSETPFALCGSFGKEQQPARMWSAACNSAVMKKKGEYCVSPTQCFPTTIDYLPLPWVSTMNMCRNLTNYTT